MLSYLDAGVFFGGMSTSQTHRNTHSMYVPVGPNYGYECRFETPCTTERRRDPPICGFERLQHGADTPFMGSSFKEPSDRLTALVSAL